MAVISILSVLTIMLMAMVFDVDMEIVSHSNAPAMKALHVENGGLWEFTYHTEATINRDELIGKIDPTTHYDFRKIPSFMASRTNMYLRSETLDSLISMHTAAQKVGIDIKVISAFRSFDHQKKIWEDKWYGSGKRNRHYSRITDERKRCKAILSYSAMPGTSRHHWGTDIDINSLSNAYFETGEGIELYEWMQQHAYRFGFCEPYSEKGDKRETGFDKEKWHWSFKPLSEKFLKQYKQDIGYELIAGFAGSEKARELNIIEDYVLGISSDCQ